MTLWAKASSLFNGERAVVLVFVARILFFLPSSLLLEALSLSLLAVAALAVEIAVDSSDVPSFFKTRRGASSGILLGAVTLPALTITRLLQLWRGLLSRETDVEELNYLKLQYWASSTCCFSVLFFLCLVIWRPPKNYVSSYLHGRWDVKLGLICIVLYGALSCASNCGLELVWLLFHGLGAVKLIQHVLQTFPSCASIGESLLVTGGLVLYFGDMLAFTVAKIHGFMASEQVYVHYGIKRSEISTIIQGLLLGLLLLPVLFNFLLRIWECFTTPLHRGARLSKEIGEAILFYSSLAFIMTVVIPPWMQFVQDFQGHPLLWVFSFVFSEPLKRVPLCLYWMGVIYAAVVRFYYISKNSRVERILLRKYYHLMAVLMFLPALIFQLKFLNLAFGAALAVFLALEIIRVWRIWPLGELVHQFMNAFTDHRDSEILIVSHFSLLLGCALPIWMSSGFNDRPLAPFAGILSLGIGDTMASVVGHKYGVLRWSKTGKKTIEGTAAGITSVLAACSIILPLLTSTGYILSQQWFSLLVAVTLSGLLEAYTAQLDNAFIPLVFYSLLCL